MARKRTKKNNSAGPIRFVAARVDEPTYWELKRLTVELRRPLNEVVIEAIGDIIDKYSSKKTGRP